MEGRRARATPLRLLLMLALPLCSARSEGPPALRSPKVHDVPTDPARTQAVIAAAYHERARMGLGSPFRLIDYALHDPRLDERARLRVARGILRLTRRGGGYQLDPVVLDRVIDLHSGPRPGTGARHLRMIDETISTAEDPRTGELTVRLAYGLAALEGTIDSVAYFRAITAAALLRDRESARRDAANLSARAHARRLEPVHLVPEWRRQRRFQVEAPALLPLSPSAVRQAVEDAPGLLADIQKIGGTPLERATSGFVANLLPLPSARALAAINRAAPLPPQTAVAVRVRSADRHFHAGSAGAARAWASFAEEALNEEQFVAQRAILLARVPELQGEVARLALYAALDLRTFAQEHPWFPGQGGPTPRNLRQRHGVRVVLTRDVPGQWAPYYRGVVDRSIADMKRAMPQLNVHGLTVRVTRDASSGWAIASYNPRKRVIDLPTTTGPGTLAHEVAHDVDRQAAVRLYGARGRYASDRASRSGSDPLAPALETLAETSRGISSRVHPHALRPREVFARNMDWYVTRTLARMGFSNGHLSSAQDEVLTGHGTVRPPGSPESYGAALRKVVRALVSPSEVPAARGDHAWRPTPAAVLRMLTSAASSTRGNVVPGARARFQEIRTARTSATAVLRRWVCDSPQPFTDWQTFSVYSDLLTRASAARARSLAVHTAAHVGGPTAVRRLLRELARPPSASSATPSDWVAALAAEVRSFGESSHPPAGSTQTWQGVVPDRFSTWHSRPALTQTTIWGWNPGTGASPLTCDATG